MIATSGADMTTAEIAEAKSRLVGKAVFATAICLAWGSSVAASPTNCGADLSLKRSEATVIERKEAVVAYHRQCVATNVETGACTNEITVPDYGVAQGTIRTGVLGALKILNKDRNAVTITELVINHREAPGCHWNGNRTLLQGDAMTLHSAECGDIINVHIKTANSACDFGW